MHVVVVGSDDFLRLFNGGGGCEEGHHHHQQHNREVVDVLQSIKKLLTPFKISSHPKACYAWGRGRYTFKKIFYLPWLAKN
jgi:hypothetical protein